MPAGLRVRPEPLCDDKIGLMGTLRESDSPPVQGLWNARQRLDKNTGGPTKRVRLIDTLIVTAVFTYNLPIQFASVPDELWSGTGVLVSAALCLPYLLRLHRPVAVFILTFAAALVQLLLGVELLAADVMLLLALYNVASRTRWTVAVPATLALLAWSLTAGLPQVSQGFLSIGELGVLLLAVVWVCTWGVLVRTRRQYMDVLRSRTEQLERERDAESRAAAAKERTRIAREIHDVVSHHVGAVGILADGAAAKVASDPEQARTSMLRVRDTSRRAVAEMRTMLGVLRDGEDPEALPQPGLDQLDALVAEFRTLGVPAELTIRGERPAEIPSGIKLAVYRVVQESLTNVRKHAGDASHAAVSITFTPNEVHIEVDDDGCGDSDHAESDVHSGRGLIGMRERVHAYGGRFDAGMKPAGGYQVRAQLPLRSGQEEQT